MTMQTLDPFYVDVNIATSAEFQARLTDYVDLVTSFPDETAICNIYRHTDAHSDPITSKIEFFKNFATGNLNLQTPDGGKPELLERKELINKNYRDQLEHDEQPITDKGGTYDNFEASGGSVSVEKKIIERKWVPESDNADEITGNGKWENEETTKRLARTVTEPLDIQKRELDVSETYDPTTAGKWFLSCWLEKFRTAHPVVQRDVKAALGGNNMFFRDFSESIGQLKNVMNYWDTSTLPMWDTDVDALGEQYSTPNTVSPVANYIVKSEAKVMNMHLARQTNRVFRSNLQGMIDDAYYDGVKQFAPGVPNQMPAHGSNFVVDSSHANLMTGMIGTIISIVQAHTLVLYGVLDMLSNRENYMQSQVPKQILTKVEEFTVAVDLLKNRIKLYNMPDTASTPNTLFGKATAYNTNMRNDEILMSDKAAKEKKQAEESSGRSLGDFFN
jgi:hypothetical protein